MGKHNSNIEKVIPTGEWLTIKEVMDRLKISRTTLYELTRDGKITAYTIGKSSVRYKSEDVDRVLTPVKQAG